MAYRFSYQKILDVKQIQEDQISTEVVLARNKLNKEKDTLSELEDKKSKALNDEKAKTENSADLLRHNSYVKQVNQTIEKQKKQIQKKDEMLSSKKDELLEASKSRKILDKLKESDLKKYNLEQNRKEQKEIDEIGAKIAHNKKEKKS